MRGIVGGTSSMERDYLGYRHRVRCLQHCCTQHWVQAPIPAELPAVSPGAGAAGDPEHPELGCAPLIPQHPVTLPAASALAGSPADSSLLLLGTLKSPKLLPHELETQSEQSYLHEL